RNQGGFAGRVGKKSQRQTGGGKFGNAGQIAEQPGSVAGVKEADRAQVFVVAAGKGGTRADASLSGDNRPVELEAKFGHGISLIDIFGGEKLGRPGAKRLLGGRDYRPVFLQAPCHIEQAEDYPVWCNPHEIMVVATL